MVVCLSSAHRALGSIPSIPWREEEKKMMKRKKQKWKVKRRRRKDGSELW